MASRQPNRSSTIRKATSKGSGRAGRGYETKVTVTEADGTTRRVNVRAATATEVRDKIKEIRAREERGIAPVAEDVETVGGWLTHWNETIVRPNLSRNYYTANRSVITRHLVPRIGAWRLDGPGRIQPEHISRMFADLAALDPPLSKKYRRDIYVALNRAFRLAVIAGRMPFNPCERIVRPAAKTAKVKALKPSHARAAIAEALKDEDYGLRWLLAFVYGPRRGEVTGIRWPQVDLDPDDEDEVPSIALETQIQRYSWEHGCPDPVECVKVLHADKPHITKPDCTSKWGHGCGDPQSCTKNRPDRCPRRIPASCRTHRAENCPPPCPPNCTKHARLCPQRKNGGLVEVDLKTEESVRPQSLGMLADFVRRHRERQIKAYAAHGLSWDPAGLMFVRFVQGARGVWRAVRIDPRWDHDQWCALLERAGVPHARQHAVRHTAGTMMAATGTRLEVIMEVLGHTNERTARRYVDIAAELKKDAADRVADRLLKAGGGAADLLAALGLDV